MTKTKISAGILGATLMLAGGAGSAQAEGWFLGGGGNFVSFEDDLKDVDSGPGLHFSGGYMFDELMSAELIAGFSWHDEESYDDDVAQASLLAGIKLSLDGEKFRPYATVGFSWNEIATGDFDDVEDDDDFEDFDTVDGFGLYAGFGADIFIARHHAVNVGFRVNSWDGDGDDDIELDVRTHTLSIAYNYYFSR